MTVREKLRKYLTVHSFNHSRPKPFSLDSPGLFHYHAILLRECEFIRSRAPCNPDPRTPPGSEESNGSGPPDVTRKHPDLASS